MLRRYRWLLFGAAAGAFAVGFLLTLAALAPVPGAPGQAAEPAAPAGDDAPCSDYSGTFVGVHDGRVAVFEGAPGGCRKRIRSTFASRPPFEPRRWSGASGFPATASCFKFWRD